MLYCAVESFKPKTRYQFYSLFIFSFIVCVYILLFLPAFRTILLFIKPILRYLSIELTFECSHKAFAAHTMEFKILNERCGWAQIYLWVVKTQFKLTAKFYLHGLLFELQEIITFSMPHAAKLISFNRCYSKWSY